MVNWMQAWWQVRQSWSFLHHAYRCGYRLHADVAADVADGWSQRRYAIAYAVAQVTPRLSLNPSGF